MRILAMVFVLLMFSIGLVACFDTLFGDDDDDDGDTTPKSVEREVHKEYPPFEIVYEKLNPSWQADEDGHSEQYDHLLIFQAKNIGDSGICKAECRVWAVTANGSTINAVQKALYLETGRVLYPGDTWDYKSGAMVDFPDSKCEFSDLKDAEIHYSFTWEKCKANVDYISVVEADIDGVPTAHVTIKNTGGVPVHNVTAEVSAWHARVNESLAFDTVSFKDGGTLTPGETAEATAVFEDRPPGFGGIDHFIRVDIRFKEGMAPD